MGSYQRSIMFYQGLDNLPDWPEHKRSFHEEDLTQSLGIIIVEYIKLQIVKNQQTMGINLNICVVYMNIKKTRDLEITNYFQNNWMFH